jgi:hypothetical protein
MEVGGNGNSRCMTDGKGNNCGIQMGAGMRMGMNEWEWEGMRMKINSHSLLLQMEQVLKKKTFFISIK